MPEVHFRLILNMISTKKLLAFGLGTLVGGLGVYFGTKKKIKALPLEEQLVRNVQFFQKGQDRIQSSFVTVVGLGGVGSHLVIALARSGVKKLRLIDFDLVTTSSLNRHACAETGDVGRTKADVLKDHINRIIPQCEVEAFNTLFSKENAPDLLGGNPDFVVDCIDNINTKADLLEYCYRNNLPAISSGGAGGKIDPTRIQICDISETRNCELMRKIRKALHGRGISSGITVVYSAEEATRKLLSQRDSKSDTQKRFDDIAKFRTRVMPVIGTMPCITGTSIATYILSKLGGVPFTGSSAYKYNTQAYRNLQRQLVGLESERFSNVCDLDVEYIEKLAKDVWRWRSAYSGLEKNLKLVRWKMNEAPEVGNLVMLTAEEANLHLKGVLEWTKEALETLESKLKMASLLSNSYI